MPLILDPDRPRGSRQAIAARVADSLAAGGKADLASAFGAVLSKPLSTNPQARWSQDVKEAEVNFGYYRGVPAEPSRRPAAYCLSADAPLVARARNGSQFNSLFRDGAVLSVALAPRRDHGRTKVLR